MSVTMINEDYRSLGLVGVSLKDLAKPSKINGLQAAGKVLLFKNNLKSRIAPPE